MNERAKNLAAEWVYWLNDRRIFGPPPQVNVLVRLMKERDPPASRGEPDGALSAELAAFHVGVIYLEENLFTPFMVVYCGYQTAPAKTPVKAWAAKFGIASPAFYDRAHKAATKVLATMRTVQLMREQEAAILRDRG